MRLVARLLLGGALLGLVRTAPGPGEDGALAANGNGRCNTPPCTCDQYGRLKCDCKDGPEELILTAEGERGLGRHTVRITVVDCPTVVLTNQSLALMDGLSSVDLVNVANLTLARHSFKLSARAAKVRITLRNCSLDALPSNVFHGDVEAILLENSRLARLESFAFANLVNTNIITLKNCRIEAIEPFAFKKFDVKFLHVIGGSLGEQVPSRAMSDVEVHDKFMLEGVAVGTVRSSAFIVRKPKIVAILDCAIEALEGQAFDVAATGAVIIKNNSLGSVAFGAFLSIRADAEGRPAGGGAAHQTLTFHNNSLRSFEAGSLVFDRASFRTELSNVLVNQPCDCERLALWKAQILNYTNAHSRLISFRDSSNVVAPPHSLESSAENPETFLCLEEPDSGAAASFVDYEARLCAISGPALLLGLLLAGLLLALLLAGCLAAYCCRRRRREARKRWISVPTSAPDVVAKAKNGVIGREAAAAAGGPVDSRITMVVPDGRLYRETEFHVIVEKAEPLTTEL